MSSTAAPAKRARTSAACATTPTAGTRGAMCVDSDKLLLAKALNEISTARDRFTAAVDKFGAFEQEQLRDLEMRLDSKRQELGALNFEFETARKRFEIENVNFFEEQRRAGAIEILRKTGEVPVSEEEYRRVREELDDLKKQFDARVEAVRREEKAAFEHQKTGALRSRDLEHRAESAKNESMLEQKNREVQVLQETIANLKSEVAAQRELTNQITANIAKAQANTAYAHSGGDRGQMRS